MAASSKNEKLQLKLDYYNPHAGDFIEDCFFSSMQIFDQLYQLLYSYLGRRQQFSFFLYLLTIQVMLMTMLFVVLLNLI